MKPNTLPLYVNGNGPDGNIVFNTLTQSNGNSSIDADGNIVSVNSVQGRIVRATQSLLENSPVKPLTPDASPIELAPAEIVNGLFSYSANNVASVTQEFKFPLAADIRTYLGLTNGETFSFSCYFSLYFDGAAIENYAITFNFNGTSAVLPNADTIILGETLSTTSPPVTPTKALRTVQITYKFNALDQVVYIFPSGSTLAAIAV
jgi:hypothetical protein